jgi:hypothetical protein
MIKWYLLAVEEIEFKVVVQIITPHLSLAMMLHHFIYDNGSANES